MWSIVSGILHIIHPSQYEMAWNMKLKLIDMECCADTLHSWPSVFTAVSIISNRETPYHRDGQSRMSWYDMITSIGPYDNAPIYLAPFGIRIDNPPGTVCAFSGMAIRHGVRYTQHPRISFAWYLRENVRHGAGTLPAQHMTQSVYESVSGYSQFRS